MQFQTLYTFLLQNQTVVYCMDKQINKIKQINEGNEYFLLYSLCLKRHESEQMMTILIFWGGIIPSRIVLFLHTFTFVISSSSK